MRQVSRIGEHQQLSLVGTPLASLALMEAGTPRDPAELRLLSRRLPIRRVTMPVDRRSLSLAVMERAQAARRPKRMCV